MGSDYIIISEGISDSSICFLNQAPASHFSAGDDQKYKIELTPQNDIMLLSLRLKQSPSRISIRLNKASKKCVVC